MTKNKKKWLEQLEYGQVVAYNVYEKMEIRELLEKYGYDETRISEGITLHKKASEFHTAREKANAGLFTARGDFNRAREKADKIYMTLVKIARVALQGDIPTLQKLHLSGDRERSYSKWLIQAVQFYSGALEEPRILGKLKEFGITKERLKEGRKRVNETETAHTRKELKRGDVLAATKKRDAAFQKMNRWVADINKINRIDLEAKGLKPKNLF